MLSQGSVVQGRNAAKGVGSSREECCHRVQLYRGGMLPKGLVAQGKNVVTGFSCTGEECCHGGLEQHKGTMLSQLGNSNPREQCVFRD
jgi:hypothetical protein